MDYSIEACQTTRDDILKTIKRYNSKTYQRPSNNKQIKIVRDLEQICGPNIIWDWGCGTGISTLHLAEVYPNHNILGIDQSIHRLCKNKLFYKEISQHKNIILAHANIIDVIMNWQGPIASKQYWLHPNPWPLKKHLKKRWQMHPIFKEAINMAHKSIMRTNWLSYAEQWHYVCKQIPKESTIETYTGKAISAFEIKFQKNNQKIYQVIC